MRLVSLSVGFFFLFAFFLNGCGFNNPKTPFSVQTDPPTPTPSPMTNSFSSLRQYVLLPKCSACHGTNMGNYDYLISKKYVVPGSPGSSVLYQDVRTGNMPKNNPALSSIEVSSIYSWIQSGAPNN